MNQGPGTKEDDDAYENSGQAYDADIEAIYGTEDAEVSPEEKEESEEEAS